MGWYDYNPFNPGGDAPGYSGYTGYGGDPLPPTSFGGGGSAANPQYGGAGYSGGGVGGGSWLGQNLPGLLGGIGSIFGGIGLIDAGNQARASGAAAGDAMQGILNQMFSGLNGISGNINGITGDLQHFQLPQAVIQEIINGQMAAGDRQMQAFKSQIGGVPNAPLQAQNMMEDITQGGLQGTQALGAEAAQQQLAATLGAGNLQLGLGGLQNQAAQTALYPYELQQQYAQQNAGDTAQGWQSILSGLGQFLPLLFG